MGDILPFVAKVRAGGDWSVSERARLEALAERFAAMADGVEVVFGATDEGDPWCVVKDAYDDILVHVARIGGRFVIHYALDDALREGADLQAVLGERLQWEEDEDRESVVVPFSRQAQSFIALIIAASFFYETQHLDPLARPPGTDVEGAAQEPAALALGAEFAGPDLPHAKAAAAGLMLDSLLFPSRSFAAASDPAPEAGHASVWTVGGEGAAAYPTEASVALLQPASWSVEPAASAMATFEASAVRVRAAAVAGPEPSPPATAGGGGGGTAPNVDAFTAGARQQTVDGTAGADRIAMGPNVVAHGGAGADIFVIQTPSVMSEAETKFGVILDFNAGEGDRLMTSAGKGVVVTLMTATALTIPTGSLTPADPHTMVVTGQRLDIDLDGDGRADGHLVLVDAPRPQAGPEHEPQPAPHYDEASAPIVLVGHSLDHYGA